MREELSAGIYEPGDYTYFIIRDPKERRISVAPFRDRVVHHALVNILEPVYEKCFISDSYATRKFKGTHRAIRRAQRFLRANCWYLKMDVRKYFDSVDHRILNAILQHKIKDPFIIALCEKIFAKGGDGSTGLPIGNLTSQFFANVYLDKLDHYVKEVLKVKYYLRYMDDFCLFDNDKGNLLQWRAVTESYLSEKLHLQIKHEAVMLNTRLHGLGFLGVRIYPSLIRIKRASFKRSYQRLLQKERGYKLGKISSQSYQASMESLVAHMTYWNDNLLRSRLYGASHR